MNQPDNTLIIRQTRRWVKMVIIDLDFCPFARRVFEAESIHYPVITDSELAPCLHAVIDECLQLDENPDIETSLIIFSQAFTGFDDFLDFVEIANALLVDRDYEGIYQLAHFHPHYCFADVAEDDASNYTNRSPWPMLHLIRESSLEQALKNYPDPENIPKRNIQLAREKGSAQMQAMLDACCQHADINAKQK